MPVSLARTTAFGVLLKVEREHSYAAELLHSRIFAELSRADHGLATELVMGVLRWQSWLDQQLAPASLQKLERLDTEVLLALRIAAYQVVFLSRVPARAAIFESVELVKEARKRSAAVFVNALLRKLTNTISENSASGNPAKKAFAEIERSTDAPALARNSAHPEWLIARWIAQYGIDRTRRICAYDQRSARNQHSY